MSPKEIRLEQTGVNCLAEILRRILINDPLDLVPLIETLQAHRLPYTYLIETKEGPDRRLTHHDLVIIGTFCDLTANGNRDPEVTTAMKKSLGIYFPGEKDQTPQIVSLEPNDIEKLLPSCRFAGSFDGSKLVYGWL